MILLVVTREARGSSGWQPKYKQLGIPIHTLFFMYLGNPPMKECVDS